MSKEPIMRQVCDCGNLIDDSQNEKFLRFTVPDLDGIHGVWNGVDSVVIHFDANKKWCSMGCFVAAIVNFSVEDGASK